MNNGIAIEVKYLYNDDGNDKKTYKIKNYERRNSLWGNNVTSKIRDVY